MSPAPRHSPPPRRRRLAAAALLLAAALPASALYKVVGPDGKVTYTDRPPSATGTATPSRVTPMATAAVPPAAAAALPTELRQVAARYPVTLYVLPNCAPCDSARALLRQRGIPYAEKIVATEDDVEALQRLVGTRDAPTLTIGSQPLRGLSADTWNAYLDSAGYPRESKLPAGFQFPVAAPLVERREAASAGTAQQRPATGTGAGRGRGDAADDAPAMSPATPASGIRF